MTADDRRRIREARDAAIRAQRLERIEAGDLDTCSGCGCDTDLRTMGCKQCGERWRKRMLRADPNWRADENRAQRYWRYLNRQRQQSQMA